MGFFFFQAEDGIRDHCVTGVQTCALPILYSSRASLTVARFVRWRPARSARSRSFWSIARFVAMVPSWILHTLLHNLHADKRLSAGITWGTIAGVFERVAGPVSGRARSRRGLRRSPPRPRSVPPNGARAG